MALMNTSKNYGFIAIVFHWLTALLVFTLFGLGVWMVEIDFGKPWYREAPLVHQSLGLILLALMLLRLIWKAKNTKPSFEPGVTRREQIAATAVQHASLLLMVLIPSTGIFMFLAEGDSIAVFNWFEIPSLDALEDAFYERDVDKDFFGTIHRYLAYTLMGLIAVHSLATFKHFFIDKDQTLQTMLGRRK